MTDVSDADLEDRAHTSAHHNMGTTVLLVRAIDGICRRVLRCQMSPGSRIGPILVAITTGILSGIYIWQQPLKQELARREDLRSRVEKDTPPGGGVLSPSAEETSKGERSEVLPNPAKVTSVSAK
ncbi:hypothetical protein BS47DRAFT_387258 [Hydnum rufescens UP504]|uniref:Uncharacterized protein n=1 Tax=Hydnum rufescens UP504 TaxID=1448309 RepID=A0A9P6AIV8_9AGAM|nr:hypothetical protein BS47DRAFT_387258 [Hydnum rufescens UP504]